MQDMSNDESSQQEQDTSNSTFSLPILVNTSLGDPDPNYIQTCPIPDSSQQYLFLQQQQQQHQIRPSQTYPQYQHNSYESANMMAHRDMGYGYMPQAIPTYSAAQSYHSTLAAMPAYYPDPSRNLSTSPNTSYLPNIGYSRYNVTSDDHEQMQRRRRRNSSDRRHQVKLLSRKQSTMQAGTASQSTSLTAPRMPSIMGTGLEESPIQTSPVDLFTTQASMQPSAYITDHYQRAASYERSPSLRDDYRATSLLPTYNITSESLSSPPSYATAYTMASMTQSMSSLVPPPMIPSPSPQHQHTYPGSSSRHTSPMPLNPSAISPHMEPLVLEHRRDKPQCWDHGCNGREFSTFSNLLRHQREKSGSATKAHCPRCGAEFTRTTARNGHLEHGKCKSRRTSAAGVSQTGSATSGSGSQGGSVGTAR